MAAATGKRNDPFISNFFAIEFDGLQSGTFVEVVGLRSETEVYEYQEGGENNMVHFLVGPSKAARVVCKKGWVNSPELLQWYEEVCASQGEIKRRNGSIVAYNDENTEVARWNLYDVWPCKWEGPGFSSAAEGKVAFETIEFAVSRIQRQ
jgi:phage tail-like protein